MCTVTWEQSPGAYHLLFNRDEKKNRAEAEPPQKRLYQGVDYLSPLDTEAGGTWLLTNVYGLTVCIVNRYPPDPLPQVHPFLSRGLLVTSCASCKNLKEVDAQVRSFSHDSIKPFSLLALQADEQVCLWYWDSRQLSISKTPEEAFLTSSSYETANVEAYRHTTYQKWQREQKPYASRPLVDFHYFHDANRGAYSICMQRDDAETQSIIEVKADLAQVKLSYAPKKKDQIAFEPQKNLSLSLKATSGN